MTAQLAQWVLLGHASLVVVLSLTTFFVYGLDKRRAKTQGRRVPERTLHLLAWFGGAPGGLMGRRTFRHKTRKSGFSARLALAMILHAAIAAALAWMWLGTKG